MPKITIACILFVFFCCACRQNVSAQDIAAAEGLSNRWSTCIVQDNEGLMWIGTINGLNRYDGYRIKQVYTPEITDNNILCLLKDKKGIIWIGTANGLNALDTRTGVIKKITLPGNASPLTVRAICERNSGELWIGDSYGVLYRVKPEYTLEKVRQLPPVFVRGTLLLSPIDFFKEDKQNRLWMITEWGYIFCYEGDEITTKSKFPEGKVYPKTLHVLSDNILLVGSRYSGLYYYNHTTGESYTDRLLDSVNVVSQPVYSSYEENEHTFWIGYNLPNPKIVRLELGKGQNKGFNYVVPDKLSQTRSHQVYQSNEGLLWVCSDIGVWKIKPSNSIFENHFYKQKHSFRALLQDKKGSFYLSSYNGFIECDSLLNPVFYALHPKSIQGAAPFVRDMLDDDKTIWCASEDAGLVAFDKSLRKFYLPPVKSKPDGMPLSDYFCLMKTEYGLWIGTKNGIYAYHVSSQECVRIMEETFNGTDIYQMKRTRDGMVLLATSRGLFVVKNKKVLRHFNSSSLPSNEINCVVESASGFVYAGTPNGLCRIHIQNYSVETFRVANGLCNNYINALLETGDGAVWASTNNGLSRFDPVKNSFTNFYQKNGSGENEFNRWSALASSNGHLLFGTVDGLVILDPYTSVFKETKVPLLFISGFSRHDSRKDTILSSDYFAGGAPLKLSVKDNFIAFDLGLTSYDDARSNRYYYRLSGIDQQWLSLGNQPAVRINSLPAGNYELELKGVNSEGTESANIISIPLEVRQVYYKSWWFRVLILLVATGITYGVYRYRIRQFLKIQDMRTRIASDLHDEVGGLLTRISIQSELLTQEKQLSEVQAEKINRIAGNSRQAVDMMGDVLWSIDGRSDTISKMVDRMHEHLSVLEEKRIKYDMKVDIPEMDRTIAGDKRQHIYLVFKEAITNIVKHSNADEVTICLSVKNAAVEMNIHDNGTVSIQNIHQGQGLRNMYMRSGKLKGKLTINKEIGFSVTLTCVL